MNKLFEAILIAALCLGIYACWPTQPPQPRFESISDKQQQLFDLGYDIAVDGKLGPETQAAWDAEWDKRNFEVIE